MKTTQVLVRAGTLAMMVALGACGGGSPTDPGTGSTPTPPPTPAAAITATGAGALVLHPRLDGRFTFALETPIRITETAGGSADWNFARISIFLSGREIERYELGADVINNAGYKRIAARSEKVYTVVFRQNSDDFDRVDITLGFGDLKDARQFTVAVPFESLSDVNISLTPMFVPPQGTVTQGGR
jgi:hypothetical protein